MGDVTMTNLTVQPGDAVVTQFGVYQHWSIVSDRFCPAGKNMLISATKRTGTVQEESWDKVTQGRHTYVAVSKTDKPVSDILLDARSQIGRWNYSLTDNNCEHFVKWCSGRKVSSSQVEGGFRGASVGAFAVAVLARNPITMKIACGAMLLGSAGVLLSKAANTEHGVRAQKPLRRLKNSMRLHLRH